MQYIERVSLPEDTDATSAPPEDTGSTFPGCDDSFWGPAELGDSWEILTSFAALAATIFFITTFWLFFFATQVPEAIEVSRAAPPGHLQGRLGKSIAYTYYMWDVY